MRKSPKFIPIMIIFIVMGTILILSGCTTQKGEGVGIYLTKGDIPPGQLPALSHLEITETPIIVMSDIVSYNSQTHELKITQSAFERIAQLEVPVQGKSFAVCVDKQPIYAGAFWTPISSISFDGVTIWKPYKTQEPYVVTLELGYPSSKFYGGEDPRNNPEVTNSLKQAGKLITKLSINDISKLPNSMKGYELYSWLENDQWHFTLITGTNRNKTIEEIIATENVISETGWIKIQVTGAEDLKTVLSKLPAGEEVFWLANPRAEPTSTNSVNFNLPPKTVIDNIQAYAEQNGLHLSVNPTH